MSRINVEQSIFTDPRFYQLIIKVGNQYAAIGALVYAWEACQRQYLKSKFKVIRVPLGEWTKFEYGPDIVACGLARLEGDSVYVCGAENQCKHYKQAREAGLKSVQARTLKFGTPVPVNASNNRTVVRKKTERKPIKTEASSSSSSSSNTKTNTKTIKTVIDGVGGEVVYNPELEAAAKLERELAEIYNDYPRKEGRKDGMSTLLKQQWSEQRLDDLATAVRNYAHSRNGKDPHYTKQFGTFANCWEEWIVSPVAERDEDGHSIADYIAAAERAQAKWQEEMARGASV